MFEKDTEIFDLNEYDEEEEKKATLEQLEWIPPSERVNHNCGWEIRADLFSVRDPAVRSALVRTLMRSMKLLKLSFRTEQRSRMHRHHLRSHLHGIHGVLDCQRYHGIPVWRSHDAHLSNGLLRQPLR
jgi:hypothetical protein